MKQHKRFNGLVGLSVLGALMCGGCGEAKIPASTAENSGGKAPLSAPSVRSPQHQAYVAYSAGSLVVCPVVLKFDAPSGAGADWEKVKNPQWHHTTDAVMLGRAANYVREALGKMTGAQVRVVSGNDLSSGVVLTLYKDAPDEIKNDPAVKKALAADPKDPYAAAEAFYIRSESKRVLVVANTAAGLNDGVVELLESVDYEVLGMGPDWVYVPDKRGGELVFDIERTGRPSYYIRQLWAHSGQPYGVGTVMTGLSDPADEPVEASSWRWGIGTRLSGSSMPHFPGHALQAYHKRVLDRMRATGSSEGFFAVMKLGLDSQRPEAGPGLKDTWWVNTDAKGAPGFEKFYYCDGKTWTVSASVLYVGSNLDVSSANVREVILEELKKVSEESFKARPGERVIFPVEPEDGGVGDQERLRTIAHKDWYPQYLAQEKLPFGRPYVLNGFKGIKQPTEMWDPASASDGLYGLCSWLLHEYDKWIDTLPADQRVTSTGKSKKELVRMSVQCYNYHDVPPNFNPENRVRVMIAPFPKHRGMGKWEGLKTSIDLAAALKRMLPDEPSGNYFFYSFSYYNDGGVSGIPAGWDPSPASIVKTYREMYDAGFRAVGVEIDFNFGKNGLGYYLASKALWNTGLTAKDMDALRDRWFKRAFGSAWQEMKAYYDFMLPANYPINTPNTWAKAIRLIDAADKKVDGAREPDAQKRIDDVKEYWYSHYLMDTGKFAKDSQPVKEFVWKGQMSYMVGMQGLLGRDFQRRAAADVAGPEISKGPAHYTRAETQKWWGEMLDYWKVVPVSEFGTATLANGKAAAGVDLNDVVAVSEFQGGGGRDDAGFLYNSGYMAPGTFLQWAGAKDESIGFKLCWPYNPNDNYYIAKKVPYGVEIWDPAAKVWTPWIDKTMTAQQSVEVKTPKGPSLQLVDVRLKAPRAGVYRFTLGYGGNLSYVSGLGIDPVTGGKDASGGTSRGLCYFSNTLALTQAGVFIYIPKGTKRLDLDVWDTGNVKTLTLHKGLPAGGIKVSRKVNIGALGVHSVALEAGEDGSLALIEGNGFCFPYLYSVPTLWAKSPGALLVPRAVAEADGLTVIGAGKGK